MPGFMNGIETYDYCCKVLKGCFHARIYERD